jgi:tetratricopeptide (TPR) repeat protein
MNSEQRLKKQQHREQISSWASSYALHIGDLSNSLKKFCSSEIWRTPDLKADVALLEPLQTTCEELQKILESKKPDGSVQVISDAQRQMLITAIESSRHHFKHLKSKLITKCLDMAISELEQMKRRWWYDATRSAEARLAPSSYTPPQSRPEAETDDSEPSGEAERSIAMRQAIIAPRALIEHYAGEVASLIRLVKFLSQGEAVNDTRGSLFYCFSELGVGKGSFYQRLVGELWKERLHNHLWACTFSHATEFSASLIGLTTFIEKIALDRGSVPDAPDQTEGPRRHRYRESHGELAYLKQLVTWLREKGFKAGQPRSGIVMAGFDALVTPHNVCRTIEIEEVCAVIQDLIEAQLGIDVFIIANAHLNIPGIAAGPIKSDKEGRPYFESADPQPLDETTINEICTKDGDLLPRAFLFEIRKRPDKDHSSWGHVPPTLLYVKNTPNEDRTRKKSADSKRLFLNAVRDYHFALDKLFNNHIRDQLFLGSVVTALLRTAGPDGPLDPDFSATDLPFIRDAKEAYIWGQTSQFAKGKRPDQDGSEDMALETQKWHTRVLEQKTEWVRSLTYRLQTTAPSNYYRAIIDEVLSQYGMKDIDEVGNIDFNSRLDFLVLQTILHFGLPAEAHVLLRTPILWKYLTNIARDYKEVANAAREVINHKWPLGEQDEVGHFGEAEKKLIALAERRRFVVDAICLLEASLARLIRRRLIGALDKRYHAENQPIEGSPKWFDILQQQTELVTEDKDILIAQEAAKMRNGFRFVLHPYLKRYLMEKISYKYPTSGDSNTFVVSTFGAQPTEVNIPSSDIQIQIDELLDALIAPWRAIRTWDFNLDPSHDPAKEKAVFRPASGEQIHEIAYNVRVKPVAKDFQVNDAEHLTFRPKTIHGFLARSSADMSACTRAAYGVLRQMRPFSVLVRLDTSFAKHQALFDVSPLDRTQERLKELTETLVSNETTRSAAIKILKREGQTETVDETINNKASEFIKERDRSDTWRQWLEKDSPINTFGPLDEPPRTLYAHEMAWIWNERGLIAAVQGKLYNAIPFYNQALRVNQRYEGYPKSSGPMTRRIELNLAIAMIDRGQLAHADKMLDRIEKLAGQNRAFTSAKTEAEPEALDDAEYVENQHRKRFIVRPLASGFKGRIAFLRGDFTKAEILINKCLKHLERQGRFRALAIMYRYKSDLLDRTGKHQDALDTIDLAIGAAKTMMQFDQLRTAETRRILLGNRQADVTSLGAATQELDRILRYSKKMGLHRLTVETLTAYCAINLKQRSFEQAGDHAAEAVAIATKFGIKTLRIQASNLLAECYFHHGDHTSALDLLRYTEEAAQRIGYQKVLTDIQNNPAFRSQI